MKLGICGHRERYIKDVAGPLNQKDKVLSVKGFAYEVFNVVQPDTIVTGLSSGSDIWLSELALYMGIDVEAYLPWKGHTVGRYDMRDFMYIYKRSNIIYTDDRLDFVGSYMYKKSQRAFLDNCGILFAVWSGNWGGTKTLLEKSVKQNKPVILYQIRANKKWFIHNEEESIYTPEKVKQWIDLVD